MMSSKIVYTCGHCNYCTISELCMNHHLLNRHRPKLFPAQAGITRLQLFSCSCGYSSEESAMADHMLDHYKGRLPCLACSSCTDWKQPVLPTKRKVTGQRANLHVAESVSEKLPHATARPANDQNIPPAVEQLAGSGCSTNTMDESRTKKRGLGLKIYKNNTGEYESKLHGSPRMPTTLAAGSENRSDSNSLPPISLDARVSQALHQMDYQMPVNTSSTGNGTSASTSINNTNGKGVEVIEANIPTTMSDFVERMRPYLSSKVQNANLSRSIDIGAKSTSTPPNLFNLTSIETHHALNTPPRAPTLHTTADPILTNDSTDSTESDVSTQGDNEDEALIPTTVDSDDETNSRSYTETSTAAYGSFWIYTKPPIVKNRFSLDVEPPDDPHKPLVFSDPVFDTPQKNTVWHSGKARIGDGNDISPNPRNLSRLRKGIQFINARMSGLGVSPQEKKEKMRLSSRICRMKRSANHEANKIKFAGLELERAELCRIIRETRQTLSVASDSAALAVFISACIAENIYHTKVAGRTSDYVNTVLENTKPSSSTDSSDSD